MAAGRRRGARVALAAATQLALQRRREAQRRDRPARSGRTGDQPGMRHGARLSGVVIVNGITASCSSCGDQLRLDCVLAHQA